ncbi:MAG: response regulator transcription factor [Thermosynechococcaceae cyanobacterium]
MIRLLLADDEPLIRRGLKALLSVEPDLQVVGEADNGKMAVQAVADLKPDLVLMDVRMPIMDGVAATKEICDRFPATKILVLTTFAEDEYIVQALRYGAVGYLLKGTASEDLVQAIHAAHKGFLQLGPGVGHQVFAQLTAPTTEKPPELAELTPREQEILNLIAQGSSNREIAQNLFISEKTVKNHITSILSRLDLRDRTQAAIWANRYLRESLE